MPLRDELSPEFILSQFGRAPEGQASGQYTPNAYEMMLQQLAENQKASEAEKMQELKTKQIQGNMMGVPAEQVQPEKAENPIRAALRQYEQGNKGILQQQKASIDQLAQYRDRIAAQPQGADLSPLMGFIDSLGGGANLSKTYKRPESAEEKQAKVFALQEAINKAQQGMSAENLKAMKERLDTELGIYKSDQFAGLMGGFKQLPKENQEVIIDLSKKNANKISIANQIDSVYRTLTDPNVSDGQKVAAGQQLIKTLNSTEGQDAVSNDERKNLASFLELFNVTGPGGVRVGKRDIDAFAEQVARTSNNVKNAAMLNNAQIQKLKQGSQLNLQNTPLNPINAGMAPWEK